MTSSTRSIWVIISCMDCPAEISDPAGVVKDERKPWKAMIIPRVNFPLSTSKTPYPNTAMFARDVHTVGTMPSH